MSKQPNRKNTFLARQGIGVYMKDEKQGNLKHLIYLQSIQQPQLISWITKSQTSRCGCPTKSRWFRTVDDEFLCSGDFIGVCVVESIKMWHTCSHTQRHQDTVHMNLANCKLQPEPNATIELLTWQGIVAQQKSPELLTHTAMDMHWTLWPQTRWKSTLYMSQYSWRSMSCKVFSKREDISIDENCF